MSTEASEPAQVYLQLRNRILNLNPADMDLHPSPGAPHVWGVMMETGYPVGSATLVSFVDGTTSLYYSTGGGMLGSGEYTPVAESSKALVAEAEIYLQQMTIASNIQLPEVGQVRFTLLTFAGTFSDAAPERMLAEGEHPLSPLFTKAHETLEQLHLLAEKKRSVRR
jgi:hypothetical protein